MPQELNYAEMSDDDLERMQLVGATAYLRGYIYRMARELGVDTKKRTDVHEMLLEMVEPLNISTEAIWRAMMGDEGGVEDALRRFREALEALEAQIRPGT